MCPVAAPTAVLLLIVGMAGNGVRPGGHCAACWICVSEVVTGGKGGRDSESIPAHAPRRRGVHQHACLGRDSVASTFLHV